MAAVNYRMPTRGMFRIALWAGTLLALALACYAIFFDPRVADTSEHTPTKTEADETERAKQLALSYIADSSHFDRLEKRAAHTYAHGCVQAHFTVLKELALPQGVSEAELRQGVLAVPGKTYPAWIRFSNGTKADDRDLDARGMAIKLMDVPGDKLLVAERHEQTQDFVMINHHTFFVRDVPEYVEAFRGQVEGSPFDYFIGFNPFVWHLRELRIALQMTLKHVPSPLSTTYHSMLPYRLGAKHAIKYSAQACDPKIADRCAPLDPAMPTKLTAHYLREALVDALEPGRAVDPDRAAARFLFRVQLQKPERNMPIEDASITWSEQESPHIPVAELTIAAQRFDSPEQNSFCENLSFTPWHALPAHEPIGGLGRARKVVYEAISSARHKHNGVARHEPRGLCLRLDGQACSPLLADKADGDRP